MIHYFNVKMATIRNYFYVKLAVIRGQMSNETLFPCYKAVIRSKMSNYPLYLSKVSDNKQLFPCKVSGYQRQHVISLLFTRSNGSTHADHQQQSTNKKFSFSEAICQIMHYFYMKQMSNWSLFQYEVSGNLFGNISMRS